MKTKDLLLDKVRTGGVMSLREQVTLAALLSYPAILAQLSTVLMQYIDASMVGHRSRIHLHMASGWLLHGLR